MSGGGGSGGGVFSGGPPNDEVDCDNVRFEANLTSVDPAVVATLSVGEVLRVELQDPPNRRVVVVAAAGIAGSLVDHLRELLRCLQRRPFMAMVLSIDGIVVRVKVEPA
jgi:hypothetical protein